MRVFIFGNKKVDKGDYSHSYEERSQYEGFSVGHACLSDHSLSLRKHFSHGYEYHHTGTYSQRSCKEIAAELLLEQHKRTADACCGTGYQSQNQCAYNTVHVFTPSLPSMLTIPYI